MDLIKEAKAKQNQIQKQYLDSVEQKQQEERNKQKELIDGFDSKIEKLEKMLSEFVGIPIRPYQWSNHNGGWRVYHWENRDIKIEREKLSYTSYIRSGIARTTKEGLTCTLNLSPEISVIIQQETTDDKPKYFVRRDRFAANEVSHWLDLPENKVWKERQKQIEICFENPKRVYEHLKEFILSTANIEEIEKREKVEKEVDILRRYLGLADTKIEKAKDQGINPIGIKLAVDGLSEFRVLTSQQVTQWFAFMASRGEKAISYFDIELAAKHSSISVEAWRVIRGMKDNDFMDIFNKCVNVDNYGNDLSKKSTLWTNYAVSFEGYFIVDCNKV